MTIHIIYLYVSVCMCVCVCMSIDHLQLSCKKRDKIYIIHLYIPTL